jgi:DNA-binding NarL/FixJ family response regulator
LRVVIADDSVLLWAGLERLLADAGFEVMASVGDGPTLLTAVAQQQPQVAIVDVRMPPGFSDEGLRAAVELRRRHPDVGVLVLSQYVEEPAAQELLATGASGIGYLLKDRVADVSDFIDAVRRVARGGTALDPEVVAQVMARRRRADVLTPLTPRERDVLALMAEGRSNAAIADRLQIGHGAVEKHVTHIFSKLALEPDDSDHRRVLAVLAFLRS